MLLSSLSFNISHIPVSYQTTQDYIREWLPRSHGELKTLLNLESYPDEAACNYCKINPSIYRCIDCNGRPTSCLDCCRHTHDRNPFHRIEEWTGQYFTPSWLWRVGLSIDLGHRGLSCPWYQQNLDTEMVSIEALDSELMDEEDAEDYNWVDPGKPTSTNIVGSTIMIIVHTNGIHYLPVRTCRCPNAQPEDIQMMEMSFYPSTYKNTKTMFTFQLLDDYLLDNLECQTSSHHYFQKLRRMTNPTLPQSVPVG